ncbi:unnamed protein product [Linum trigynum]|uniref:Phospholipase D C-terminal domain-containing protein n=1 Tax=Linum trigynum TaxID=586398 RepID=A0AAV2E828_9ROSI
MGRTTVGAVEEEWFDRPESVECVRKVRTIGEENWRRFAGEVVLEMKGQLMKYPVDVDLMGRVGPLPWFAAFPDVGGNILDVDTVAVEYEYFLLEEAEAEASVGGRLLGVGSHSRETDCGNG